MSAPKRKDGVVNIEALIAEAEKKATEPFRLQISVDEVIEIPEPDGEAMLKADEARTSRELMKAVCGEKYDEVMKAVGHLPRSVLKRIGEQIQEHFSLGE